MEQCKLQIGCLIVLLYIAVIYNRDYRKYHRKTKYTIFIRLLSLGIGSVMLDGITAYTVNHLNAVTPIVNLILHMFFLLSLDAVVFTLFLYMMHITGAMPKKNVWKIVIYGPFVLNILILVFNISSLEYIRGTVTNYSMGISVYTCFVMVAVYMILSIIVFLKRWNYIESHKRINILTYLLVMFLVTGIQMFVPEVLLTSLAVTVLILGVYMNQENPVFGEISRYHSEMVMGFANLIENRDDSTGGHIKRTSMYVELIAGELRERGYYQNVLTKDYILNLLKAAPMHDIGKISVPDAILQKPGRLTEEEFAMMKLHTENGGKIIQETFGKMGNKEYLQMAYEVARFHHEKWNGKGYPDGLKEDKIPLCARIMAVADVFDAVSEKRCYRDAMPLDKCFDIIKEGSGKDFEPVIAEVFLDIRDKVEKVHGEFEKGTE